MPKGHKPGKASNISLARQKGTQKVISDWKIEDTKSYLVVPRNIRSFHRNDPRKAKWRVTLLTEARK